MTNEKRLVFAMQQISHNFKEVLAQSKTASNCDLSLHDCRLVEFIGNNSYTLNEIANHFQVTPGTMSTHVERMVVAGILTRKRDEEDRRKTYISLSKEGLDYYSMLQEKIMDFSKKTLETIPKEDQDKIIELFEKMARIDLK